MSKKLEIERKFLLRRLPETRYSNVFHITQYYLKDNSRIRESRNEINKPSGAADVKYYLTRKKKLAQGVYEEDERKISEEKFNKLSKNAISKISKSRHILKSGKLKWEIDRFNNIELVTAEIELKDLYAGFKMPKSVAQELIMDVTEFPQFTNKALSLKP